MFFSFSKPKVVSVERSKFLIIKLNCSLSCLMFLPAWGCLYSNETLFMSNLQNTFILQKDNISHVGEIACRKETQNTTNKYNWIRQVWGALIASFVWICHLAGWPLCLWTTLFTQIRLVSLFLRRLNERVKGDMTNWVLTRLKMIFFHASFQLHNCRRHKRLLSCLSLPPGFFSFSFCHTKPSGTILLKTWHSSNFFLGGPQLFSSFSFFAFANLVHDTEVVELSSHQSGKGHTKKRGWDKVRTGTFWQFLSCLR